MKLYQYFVKVTVCCMLQIEALPEVVEAVKHYNVEVYMDGGVSTGTDVYKALTLGAKAVSIL